jgi:hypothetical protein
MPKCLLVIILLTGFNAFADTPLLPFFVPALVKQNFPKEVRTLASFELVTSLRLHPEFAQNSTLDAQMQLQFEKLHVNMPLRSSSLEKKWLSLREQIKYVQTDLVVPPGIDWGHWAKPLDEDIQPVAVSTMTYDGRLSVYLSAELFPLLPASEQAQVIWQLLWSQELQTTDNIQVRLISNYLFSREWRELTMQASYELFKKIGFDYFEAQGFCFRFDLLTEFNQNGSIKKAFSSEKCKVQFKNRELIFKGQLEFDEFGYLIPHFNLSNETPWVFIWEGHIFNFSLVNLFQNDSIAYAGGTGPDGECVNVEKNVQVKTSYALIKLFCSRLISFYDNGVASSIDRAEAIVNVQGSEFLVGNYKPDANGPVRGDLYFHKNGALKSAYFPKGTRLRNLKGKMIELKDIVHLELNDQGLVTNIF